MLVPFFKPSLPSWEAIEPDLKEMYSSGMLAPGKYGDRFLEKMKQYLNVRYTVGFNNCSSGLMALAGYMKKVTNRNKVIIPNFTFASSWQAGDWNNMDTILVDTDQNGLISIPQVEEILKKQGQEIAYIMAVHMFGNPAPVEDLQRLGIQYQVPIIYDSAHGLGSLYKNKRLGNWGAAEVFSFGTTKPLSAGEGGLLTTNDPLLADAMQRAAQHGHKVGTLDVEVKSLNGRLQEWNSILAYYGVLDLEEQIVKRNELAQEYISLLTQHLSNEVRLLIPDETNRSIWKDFTVVINNIDIEKLSKELMSCGIGTKRYYYPSIDNLFVIKNKLTDTKIEKPVDLSQSHQLAQNCISLPFYTDMTKDEINYVVQELKKCLQ